MMHLVQQWWAQAWRSEAWELGMQGMEGTGVGWLGLCLQLSREPCCWCYRFSMHS